VLAPWGGLSARNVPWWVKRANRLKEQLQELLAERGWLKRAVLEQKLEGERA